MTKIRKGDRIRINTLVSPSGRYRGYGGREGFVDNIIKNGDNYLYDIKLDNGIEFYRCSSQIFEIIKTKTKMITKINLESQLKHKQSEVEILREKIDFLSETGQEEFNENEFKAYRILTLFEGGELSKAEKAKKIAELVK